MVCGGQEQFNMEVGPEDKVLFNISITWAGLLLANSDNSYCCKNKPGLAQKL